MGFIFEIQHANIVAYLTSPRPKPPRMTYWELHTFLAMLGGDIDAHQSTRDLFGARDERMISSSDKWIERVIDAANQANTALPSDLGEEQVPEDEVILRLGPLRRLLEDYNLFGLALGSWRDDSSLRHFISYAAID